MYKDRACIGPIPAHGLFGRRGPHVTTVYISIVAMISDNNFTVVRCHLPCMYQSVSAIQWPYILCLINKFHSLTIPQPGYIVIDSLLVQCSQCSSLL